jgi:subtilisin family serine protease
LSNDGSYPGSVADADADVDDAWAVSRGACVTVGVVDTGVDATHADLQGQLVPGRDLVPDTVPDHDPRDVHGHGTHVTGTIAVAEALRTLLRNVPRNGRLTLEVSDRARRIVVLRADVVFASSDVVRLERQVPG